MNIYEQLQSLRVELQAQGAKPETMQLVDRMVTLAEPQRDTALSFSRLQVLRRLMSMPEALNNEEIRLDLLALEGDLEEAAARRSVEPAAYEEADRKPKLKKFYKKK